MNDITNLGTAILEIPFIRRGDSAYVIVEGPTWEEAEANAVALGGHLVTINDADENEWIQSFSFRGSEEEVATYWLGLTDQEEEGTWHWISGDEVNFPNWAVGEPNAADQTAGPEDYAIIFSNSTSSPQWFDVSNSNAYFRGPSHGYKSLGLAEIPLAPNNTPT